jgi:LPS export ABC transporter protein LptC
MVAITIVVATIAISCKNKLSQTDQVIDIKATPSQVVENIVMVQSRNSQTEFRMQAPVLQRYDSDPKNTYDLFPAGLNVYGYNEEGLLETSIVSDQAKHSIMDGEEKWSAYGNVVIKNFIKGEQMETDTIFWDQKEQKIYTHCYVKLHSPQGFMQGVGMESDEMARNAVLLNPYDGYAIINNDSTKVSYVDSVNFIGPLVRR